MLFRKRTVRLIAHLLAAGCLVFVTVGASGQSSTITLPVVPQRLDSVNFARYVARVAHTNEGSSGSRIVYSNLLGPTVFAPSRPLLLIADDIATTTSDSCVLESLLFHVSGDPIGDGSGIGPFSVNFSLYDACPGAGGLAVFPPRITDLPDNGDYAVVFIPEISEEISVSRNMYFGVSFSRNQAGIVVGAPAEVGFSADLFDFPSLFCSANFGGPDSLHGSIDLEVRVRDDCPGGSCTGGVCDAGTNDGASCTYGCPTAFPAYKNSLQSGDYFTSAPANVFFADDIQLAIPVDQDQPCDLVAWGFGAKGNGFVRAALHTFLDAADPENGGLIVGSTIQTLISSDTAVTMISQSFSPPISLTQQDLFAVFRTSSSSVGAIRTCREADLGATEDVYFVYTGEEWVSQSFVGCHSGFEVNLSCAGSIPVPEPGAGVVIPAGISLLAWLAHRRSRRHNRPRGRGATSSGSTRTPSPLGRADSHRRRDSHLPTHSAALGVPVHHGDGPGLHLFHGRFFTQRDVVSCGRGVRALQCLARASSSPGVLGKSSPVM